MKLSTALALLSAFGVTQLRAQTVDKPLQVTGDVKPPVLVKQVEPKFSSRMRREATEKDVAVHLVVDEKGLPVDVRVVIPEAELLTADPDFANSAVEAVKKYRFQPATLLGKPVAVVILIGIHFQVGS